jgi:hypothetical protein
MPVNRLTAWLRPLMTLAALAAVLSLAACGGGNGAPNNMFQSGGTVTPLSITPATATAYSGNPFTFVVTGGTQPYTIVSSDQAALPVVGTLTGNTLVVVPGNVGADTAVTLSVRDAAGLTTSAAVTVRPALLLPSSIKITGNPNCSSSGATLCSGQDGSALVQLLGPGGAPLAGRGVRFDVVQGDFGLSSTAPGQPVVQSLTITTDQNGNAAVRLVVPSTASTQVATLRATDVTSGSSVVGQFTIAQFVNGNSVLSVIPTGVTTFTGPDNQTCSSGASATFYVFGGTPPYTIATNFPQAITITGNPLFNSGDGFTITTNGTCFTGLTFAITDANGRTLLTPPTASNVVGTAAPVTPLAINPSSASCVANQQNNFDFLVTGGSGTYSAIIAPNIGTPLAVNNGVLHVTIPAAPANTYTLTVSSGGKFATATITCK